MNIVRPTLILLFLATLLLPLSGFAATTLNDLYKGMPAPPRDAASAIAWVQDGKVVAPEILALEANLQAAHASALSAASTPAAAPKSAATDSAAVTSAADAYRAYAAANDGANAPAAVLGGRVKWLSGRFTGLGKRVAGTDRMGEVREQELAAYRALFTDWQTQRAPILSRAQAELAAAGEPAAIQSPENRASVQRYRAAMLNEVEVLLGLTRFSVERAAGLGPAEPSIVEPSANTLWDLMTDPRKRPPS